MQQSTFSMQSPLKQVAVTFPVCHVKDHMQSAALRTILLQFLIKFLCKVLIAPVYGIDSHVNRTCDGYVMTVAASLDRAPMPTISTDDTSWRLLPWAEPMLAANDLSSSYTMN